MSLTSKSPRMVILVALAVGKEALPSHAHRFSPKTYTQPQLFACLVYMVFLGTDYRGVEQRLADFPQLREWLGLKRTPESFGNPFADAATPAWFTEQVRQQHWDGVGPHSAREVNGFGLPNEAPWMKRFPLQITLADSMQQVRRMFDGYDCGVAFSDLYVGKFIDALRDRGVLDQTAIIISADHGENLGELNIYGDHQTADQITCNVPLVIRRPGSGLTPPRPGSASAPGCTPPPRVASASRASTGPPISSSSTPPPS